MKTKRIFAILLSIALLLSVFSCGKPAIDPLDGPVKSIDNAQDGECFFGSIEEIRALYDAIAGGDEAVRAYVAAREAEKEYMDDLSLVDSAAKARFLLLDILDKPVAVFPEETTTEVYYFRSYRAATSDSISGVRLEIEYKLNEDKHLNKGEYITVSVDYGMPRNVLEQLADIGGTPVESLEIDGYEMNISMDPSWIDDEFNITGVILLDGSYTEIRFPRTENVKETVARLEKLRVTTLRAVLGIGQ